MKDEMKQMNSGACVQLKDREREQRIFRLFVSRYLIYSYRIH